MNLEEWQAWWKASGRDALNRILVDEWNPIGINVPDDEYSGYAGTVGRLLQEGKPDAEIAAALSAARTESMELAPHPEEDARAAASIGEWYRRETGAE